MKTQGSEADATTASKVMPASIGALRAEGNEGAAADVDRADQQLRQRAGGVAHRVRQAAQGVRLEAQLGQLQGLEGGAQQGTRRQPVRPRPGRDPGAGSEPRPQVVFDRRLARLQPFALARAIGHALLSKT